MNEHQSFIARAKAQIVGAQRKRAVERAQEKREASQSNVDLALFVDTCLSEGLDPRKPGDMAVILRAAMMRFGQHDEEDTEEGPFLD